MTGAPGPPSPESASPPRSPGQTHSARRRFTVVIVGVVAGALIVSGLGTLVLLRVQAHRETRRGVVELAANVAHTAGLIERPLRLSTLQAVLRRTQDVAIVHLPRFQSDRLPRGMRAGDLRLGPLEQGQTLSGYDGQIAYAIVPFRLRDGELFAAAATQPASQRGAAPLYLLLSAAVALVVAGAAAEFLARRVSRPLVAAERATRLIAEGDLSVRVPIDRRSSDELNALAESINTMAASLERLRGAERQFLMSVSHDLRTPLTSIRGFAEALADGTTTDTARAAGVIAAEARRLERLVGDLLDLAKLDARRFSLDVRAVDLHEVVDDTAEGFVPTAERLGLRLTVHDPVVLGPTQPASRAQRPFPPVAADPDRLAQVMANLIENAMKFAARTIDVATWFVAAPDGSLIAQITVDDDGPGIAPEDLPHVFDRRRTTTRGMGRQVGSGLGLAIVAELVSAMGGSMHAESPAPGGPSAGDPAPESPAATTGTRVTVTLRCWSNVAAGPRR